MTISNHTEGISDSVVTLQSPSINDHEENPILNSEHLKTNGVSKEKINDDETNDEIGECGLGTCRPRYLRVFRNLTMFCVVYAISGVFNFALTMSFATQLTSIEKQFNLTGTTIGLMTTIKDMGILIPTLFLGYIIRRVHVSRWIASATFLYGVGGLLCIIPYLGTREQFLLNNNHIDHVTNNTNVSYVPSKIMCGIDLDPLNNTLDTEQNSISSSAATGGLPQVSNRWHLIAKYLFFGTEFLQGVCRAIKFAFLPVFLDDNAEPGTFAKYLGLVFTIEMIFSPGMSMGLGAALSKVYVTLEETSMTFTDPRWVSAWWLGFLVFGTLSIAATLPLLLFPRKFKLKKEIEQIEKKRITESKGKNRVVFELKGFAGQIFKLCSSPLYVLVVIGTSVQVLGTDGARSFNLQFKALYFGMDQAMVNLLEGVAGTFIMCIGLRIGVLISSRLGLSAYDCLKLRVGVSAFICGLTLLYFLAPCHQPQILSTSQHPNPSSFRNISCDANCHCDPNIYFPICGDNGQTYYSPCDAGCTEASDDGRTFSKCECMSNSTTNTATAGICSRNCERNFWIYMGLELFRNLIHPIPMLPFWIVILRSVDEEQKPMALAMWNFLNSVLGNIPGPIIFGKLVDTACLVIAGGGTHGACLLYDMPKFRFLFIGFGWVFELAGTFILLLALIYVRCSKNAERYKRREKNDLEDKVDAKKK